MCPSMQMLPDHDGITFFLGSSVSLSSDGRILAIGGPGDNNGIGATWIFVSNGSVYQQLGQKLVATDSSGVSRQGKGRAKLMVLGRCIS